MQATVRVALPVLDDHPSSYVVRDLVDALIRLGIEVVRLPPVIGKVLTRAGLYSVRPSKRMVIVPMMGPRFDLLVAAQLHGQPVPFCWDVWEPQWDLWTRILNRLRPPLVITTASASANHLSTFLESSLVRHLPEAANYARYNPGGPLRLRQTDILELGRRNNRWHDEVSRAAEERGFKHLYERTVGQLTFPNQSALIAGLADSKISVCFPSNVTHPERAGSVSTVTSRYFESMASRCLVLGETPHELSELLGFDPGVEVDMQRPWEQLQSAVDSIDAYQGIVDEAYERGRLVGGWDYRARQLLDLVRDL